MAKTGEEPLLFRGVPLALRAFVPIRYDEIASAPSEVVLERKAAPGETVSVQSAPRGPSTEIRLQMPQLTPAGDYPGTLRLGERRMPIVVRVDARPHLAAIPSRIDIVNGAGEAGETLTLLNDGNTVIAIDPKYAFGLFEMRGLDRAIGKTFQADAANGYARVDTFMSAAADEYGGVVTATVTEGAGPLEPGQTRAVTFAFGFPQKPLYGSAYFGYLIIAGSSIPVFVRNEQRAKPPEVPA